jgi:hypothetical protein
VEAQGKGKATVQCSTMEIIRCTGWCREMGKFEIIRKNEGNLQNFI